MKAQFLGVLDRLAVANKLPAGHYDRVKAETAVSQEYALAREFEKTIYARLAKRRDLKFYYRNRSTAMSICDSICDYWKVRRIKAVVLDSPDVKECSGGHYSHNEIHIKGSGFGIITLLHELAHHFAIKDIHYFGHGKDFVMYEGTG